MKCIWCINYRLVHALFHFRTGIIPRDQYRPEGFSPRVGHGMVTVLKRKKACINLFIIYFNIELRRIKLTSHTDTKLIWIWVIDISWEMITVMIWQKGKQTGIDLFIKRLDIMLSEFCHDICPWADIAVALPVLTSLQYRQRHGTIDIRRVGSDMLDLRSDRDR